VRYGGNTSCVEVTTASGTTIVLDCGTGAALLGSDMMRRGGKSASGALLISHSHWDHIQGLPFFVPAFVPGNEWDVYAPHGFAQSVRETLAGQMQHTYFPVELSQLGATIRYHDLTEGGFSIGEVKVTTRYLNHPALTLGYRLEADGVTLVYCCDHEPHSRSLAYGSGEIGDQDRDHIDFIADADLLIHDAQYRAAEYAEKVGWGHSTLEYVVAIAQLAEVKALAFTHHDPARDDEALTQDWQAARDALRAQGSALALFAAAEGETIELAAHPAPTASHRPQASEAEIAATPQPADQTVLLGIADTPLYDALWQALRDDGIRVIHASTGTAAIALASSQSPSLVVLERYLPGDGLATCRAIRESGEPALSEIPIIITASDEDIGAGGAAGVTDWLVKPFSAIYARTRMRAWLMRIACRWARPPTPPNERERLAALYRLAILDSEREERFDCITRVAAAAFDVPVALVTLVDAERQWFKSACGFDASESPRDLSFCAHTILEPEIMIVPDTLLDPRFADHPAVIGDPRIRFYAGCPLILPDGSAIGTLCLVDTRPRQLDEAGRHLLADLASLVLRELETGAQ
jgi:phosphoribosyl 1,2-cyclic phosphodiesterase/DNA-binding response OmpR family regulator